MSNLAGSTDAECDLADGCGAIELTIAAREADLGGFSVRRVLPNRKRRMVGPWVFFDHMGPAQFPAGQGVNVRPHPHINLATVTYLFAGEILHRDSVGSVQAIRPGDINLMVAGSGIVHSERERPEVTAQAHEVHGLQLWLALPEEDEECAPAFHHYPASEIPETVIEEVPVRVMMGSAYGLRSPVRTFANTLYLEASLQPGQRIELPDAEERAVYVAAGRLCARDSELAQHTMTVFQPTPGVTLEAVEETRLALIGGGKLGPRFIDWNFVSSRKERIAQAREDWRTGKFPKVPGDEEEFIPLPE